MRTVFSSAPREPRTRRPWTPHRRMTTSPTTTCSMHAKRPRTRASERSRPILAPRPRTSRAWAALGPIPRRRPTRPRPSFRRCPRPRPRPRAAPPTSRNLRRKRAFSDVLRPHPQTPTRDDRARGTPRLRTRAAGGGGGIARRRRAASVAIVAGPNPCGSTMSARCLRVALKIHRAASHASESGEYAPPPRRTRDVFSRATSSSRA